LTVSNVAQTIAGRASSFSWVGQFLKEELSPYPGRFGLVARMVLATTIVMIVSMTFQLSFAFQGALIALLVSRESARSTLQSAYALVLFTGLAAIYLLVSAWFVISNPTLHLLWVFASFFLAFFIINALNNYSAAVIFSAIISAGIPLWDRYVPAEKNVEDTLRLVLVTVLGIAATLAVELALVRRKPGDQIVQPIVERLEAVGKFLACVAEGCPTDGKTASNLARLGIVGTSRLRRILLRSNYSPHFVEQMGALTALTGRIVDSVASWTPPSAPLSDDDRKRMRRLAENLATICADLLARRTPHLNEPLPAGNALSAVPILAELERIVSLIPETFIGSHPLKAYVPPASGEDPPQRIFAWDTRSNAEHIRFALKGCLTASLCYVFYNLVDWQGISTSVTTCFLTALSTIGASRQKQVLRFAGATVGGFVFGMGSQIFILPYLDTIGGFTVLFIFVTALSSWVMTSSTRLSYLGLQMALAYYLINLQEFAFQTSLAIARDRVVGVLFGLIMMWFVFDQLGAAPALVAMKKTFVANLRLLARLAREPVSTDMRTATNTYFSLRETISGNVDSVRSLADGVLLEFDATREQGLAWRREILAWQPLLRTLFLTQVVLWKYRAQLPGFELPEPVRLAERAFDDQAANMLDGIADGIERKTPAQETDLKKALAQLAQAIQAFRLEHPQDAMAPQFQTYIPLSTKAERLTTSLKNEIQSRDR
jgi:multidrug resistance protein MdtO